MNKIIKFFNKHQTIAVMIILLFVVFLSHGKTMQMYYWVDDWAMNYKVLWPEESPGNMGSGIFGTGPYRYLVTPFIYLYPLFGFNAFPYFAIGWFLYFLAAVSVYLLSRELTQRQDIALAASSIFASGYIGAHALYRLTNSYQTVGATFLICLTVWAFARFLRIGKNKFFWMSIILYVISMELVWIRTHGSFLSIFATAILYKVSNISKASFKQIGFWLLPFLTIFYFMYFVDPRIRIGSNLVLSGMDVIIKEGHVELFNNLMITLANAFIPDHITQRIYSLATSIMPTSHIFLLTTPFAIFPVFSVIKELKQKSSFVSKFMNIHSILILLLIMFNLFVYWSFKQKSSIWHPSDLELLTTLLGGCLSINFLYISYLNFKNKIANPLLIPLALFWVVANSITLFIYSPETNLESTSRYLVPAFAGVGILYAVTLFTILPKTKAILAVVVLCAILIFYSNKEAGMLIKNNSLPDKQGYNLILNEVDKVDKNTVFYIEAEDEPQYKDNYLGRLPQLGISALFNYHGITTVADSYDQLFSLLSNNKTNLDQIYVYFFGTDGYRSMTFKVRSILESGGERFGLNDWSSDLPSQEMNQTINTETVLNSIKEGSVGVNPTLETIINYDSLVPSVLEFSMTVSPMDLTKINFPYFDVTKQYSPQIGAEHIGEIKPITEKNTKVQILSALKEEGTIQNFRSNVKVKATSFWKTTNESFLTDGREDTNWGADNNQWSSIPKPQDLIIDLGKEMAVTSMLRINHYYMSTPTVYNISVSTNGITWTKILDVKSAKRQEGGEIIQDKFTAPMNTRFIKMNILETFGGPGHPPAIKELWISNREVDMNPQLSKTIIECPFCYISDLNIASDVMRLSASIATARMWWETDRRIGYHPEYSQSFRIIPDGQPHTYTIHLPAQGTKFKKIKIDSFQIPLEVVLSNVSIKSLSLEELQKENLIKKF